MNVLMKALVEINQGLIDVSLGGGLYKKRIPRIGRGKRGGYRVLIAFKLGDRAIFMYGFSKNEIANLSHKEVVVFKKLANYYFEISDEKLDQLVNQGELFEVTK